MNTAYPTLADIQRQYVAEQSSRYFDSYGRSPRDTDAIIQERDGYTMRTIATFGELKANERPELAHFFTDYLGLCETCYTELPNAGDCIHCSPQSDLPTLDTTADYMAYQAGFAAGQKEYQELPESTVRTMHAAMRQSLARPAIYPTGITGMDRAHMEGRCDAYGYYLRNHPPTLLSLVRTNIKQRRAKDAAAYDCDCHLQAGYDTGYAQQYLDERDRLWRIYYDACEAESVTEHALFALVNEDRIEYGRIQRIVFDFS